MGGRASAIQLGPCHYKRPAHHAKCAKALFASAMRCVCSRVCIALPSPRAASYNSRAMTVRPSACPSRTASGVDDPAEAEALATALAHLHRHLVVGAADALRADLDVGPNVVDRAGGRRRSPRSERPRASPSRGDVWMMVERVVDASAAQSSFLPSEHDAVDELRQRLVAVPRGSGRSCCSELLIRPDISVWPPVGLPVPPWDERVVHHGHVNSEGDGCDYCLLCDE